MRQFLLAAAALVILGAPALAEAGGAAKAKCPQEADVRQTAAEIEAQQVVPLRATSGRRYLMLVLPSGDGLVMTRSHTGCFDAMLAMPKEAVIEVLTNNAPT